MSVSCCDFCSAAITCRSSPSPLIAPLRVRRAIAARAGASAPSCSSQFRTWSMAAGGSRPRLSRFCSGIHTSSAGVIPASLSICCRSSSISCSAPSGTRLSTTATVILRSAARCSNSHGTASAYRLAVVTKSHRSAAESKSLANRRFCSETESISGASIRAMPGGTVWVCSVTSTSASVCASAPGTVSPAATL